MAVIAPRTGARAYDVQGPEQRPEQGPVRELLLVCSVARVSPLRSPAVLRLSDQAPVVSTPIQKNLPVRGCVVTGCTACCHSVALLDGLLGPDDSTKLILAEAFVDVRALTYKELRGRFILEAGQVWTAGGMRIMIRDHYPALFRSMCKNANVGTIGDNTAWAKRFNGGHALLRGTAGTGKSVFMFVMFIEFLKMLRAPPTEEVAEVDGVVVFNPAVGSIRIQWNGVYGGNPIVLGESPDYRRRVHLFDAGDDPPVRELPGSEGEGYFLATASADPIHYRAWDSKQPQMKRQYSVPWSMEELQALIKLNCDTVNISEEQLGKRSAVVGGVPSLILNTDAARLLAVVRERAGFYYDSQGSRD